MMTIEFDEKTTQAMTLLADSFKLESPEQAVMLSVGLALNGTAANNELFATALTELGWRLPPKQS